MHLLLILNNGKPVHNAAALLLKIKAEVMRYGDGAGNTVEENSSVFSLI